jgi:hypothetical protein
MAVAVGLDVFVDLILYDCLLLWPAGAHAKKRPQKEPLGRKRWKRGKDLLESSLTAV